MNHIPKKQWMGCAVATAAMLSDRTYDEVAAHWPKLDEASTRCSNELRALLEAVTDAEWYLCPCWAPQARLADFVPSPSPVAAWIQDSVFHCQFGQWVVVSGGVVHDPGESAPYSLRHYPLRDWVVTEVIQQEPPVELKRIQERRWLKERRK